MKPKLRLGTRGSLLARSQSQLVAHELMRLHPGLEVELITIRTTGDQVLDRPLHDIGGKGLFTKELGQALIDGLVDFAVHSFKDVPVTMPLVDESRLVIAAVPPREDPCDVAVMFDPLCPPLRPGARIGSSSLRRRCQILELMPDAQILPLRGNIDTRIRKLKSGEYDVVVLAMAGLKRAGLFDETFMRPLEIVPAPAQGALALQCRADDHPTRRLLAVMNDANTAAAVELERQIVRELQGDCHSPIAALATMSLHDVKLTAAVGGRDGNPPVVRASASSPVENHATLSSQVVGQLIAAGADKLLKPLK